MYVFKKDGIFVFESSLNLFTSLKFVFQGILFILFLSALKLTFFFKSLSQYRTINIFLNNKKHIFPCCFLYKSTPFLLLKKYPPQKKFIFINSLSFFISAPSFQSTSQELQEFLIYPPELQAIEVQKIPLCPPNYLNS